MSDTICVCKNNQMLQLQQDRMLAPTQCKLTLRRRNKLAEIALPPSVNPIVQCKIQGDDMSVTTMHPHGLFVCQGTRYVLAPDRCNVCISPTQALLVDLNIEYQDCTEFVIKGPLSRDLLTSIRPSTSFLCALKPYTLSSLVSSIADRLPHDVSISCDRTTVTLFDQQAWLPSGLSGGVMQILPLGVSNISPGRASVSVSQTAFSSTVALRPSEYTTESFCRGLSNVLNHIYLDSPVDITFEDLAQSTNISVTIDAGSYTLSSLGQNINKQLQTNKSTIKALIVDRNPYVVNSNGLSFQCQTEFGVQFADCLISDKLGYQKLNLRGKRRYMPNAGALSTLGALDTNKMAVLSCNAFDQHVDISVSLPEPIGIKIGTFADGRCTVITNKPHAFDVDDIVKISTNIYRVCAVGSTTFKIETSSPPEGKYVMFAISPTHVSIAGNKNLVEGDNSLHIQDIIDEDHQSS